MVCAPTIRPPPPSPCTARNTISSRMRLRQAGQRGADQEDHDRGLEEHLPAVHVAELAPQRRGHRGGQQVRGDHPGQVRQPVQVTGDGRQRGRDDGLVEGGQQHAQQQRADDHQHAPLGHGRRLRASGRGGLGPARHSALTLLEIPSWHGRGAPDRPGRGHRGHRGRAFQTPASGGRWGKARPFRQTRRAPSGPVRGRHPGRYEAVPTPKRLRVTNFTVSSRGERRALYNELVR